MGVIGDFYVRLDADGDIELETRSGADCGWLTEEDTKELVKYFISVYGAGFLDESIC